MNMQGCKALRHHTGSQHKRAKASLTPSWGISPHAALGDSLRNGAVGYAPPISTHSSSKDVQYRPTSQLSLPTLESALPG